MTFIQLSNPLDKGKRLKWGLCAHKTPLPIALDEELIGVNNYQDKVELLTNIKPQYIILKPSLLGGWKSCDEWIEIAEKFSYWMVGNIRIGV